MSFKIFRMSLILIFYWIGEVVGLHMTIYVVTVTEGADNLVDVYSVNKSVKDFTICKLNYCFNYLGNTQFWFRH